MLTYEIPPEFRGGVHFLFRPPYAIGAVPRVYRVTQLRTDRVHCRESAGTGPVNLKIVPNGCCPGRSSWTNSYLCVCVFFLFILDIKFVGRTRRGHTGFFVHLSAVGCCCCCLHIKSRSDLYSKLSNIRTGPTDANAFRGHRLTTQKGYTYRKEIKGPRKVNTHAIIGKENTPPQKNKAPDSQTSQATRQRR